MEQNQTESESEDEISRLKREALERAYAESSSSENDYDSNDSENGPTETAVFIPKIKREEIVKNSENDIELLRQMQREYGHRNQLQESILI